MSIQIDHERKVTIVTLTGPFDLVKVKAVVDEAHRREDYNPRFSALYDLRDVTMDGITADQLQRLAFDIFDPSWDGTRFAMVATDDAVFGMARVYAAVADETGRLQRRAFRDYDAALEWVSDA